MCNRRDKQKDVWEMALSWFIRVDGVREKYVTLVSVNLLSLFS